MKQQHGFFVVKLHPLVMLVHEFFKLALYSSILDHKVPLDLKFSQLEPIDFADWSFVYF